MVVALQAIFLVVVLGEGVACFYFDLGMDARAPMLLVFIPDLFCYLKLVLVVAENSGTVLR